MRGYQRAEYLVLCMSAMMRAAWTAAGSVVTGPMRRMALSRIPRASLRLRMPLSKSASIKANVTATAYADAKKQGAVLGYGQFLTVALNFIIVAFVLFLAIRAMNKLTKREDARPEPAEPSPGVKVLTEIRDILARK
jgi:large conductance mechanosensitive channel